MTLVIEPSNGLKGELKLPGDKSISHRALMLGAIADGDTTVINFLNTGDCLSTVRCLSELGVQIDGIGGQAILVHGRGLESLSEPADVMDAGNSATTARLLTGLLAGQKFFSSISGDDSLRERPMRRVVEPLMEMGALINGRDAGNRLPLAIRGTSLKGVEYNTPVASAQIKSALLLAGLYAEGATTVVEPGVSRDHTERLLEVMGADIETSPGRVTVRQSQGLHGVTLDIPADLSSAAFFIVAALITGSSNLIIKQVGTNNARIGLLDTLKQMGADIKYDNMNIKNREPRSDIIVVSTHLNGVGIKKELIPRMIDEIPILAVAATQANGTTTIKGAGELRLKETDRLRAIVENLNRMGANIKETEDGLIIKGPVKLKGAAIETYGDHRIAMAMAVAGLVAEGRTVIDDEACIDVSFPGFERMLKNALVQ